MAPNLAPFGKFETGEMPAEEKGTDDCAGDESCADKKKRRSKPRGGRGHGGRAAKTTGSKLDASLNQGERGLSVQRTPNAGPGQDEDLLVCIAGKHCNILSVFFFAQSPVTTSSLCL